MRALRQRIADSSAADEAAKRVDASPRNERVHARTRISVTNHRAFAPMVGIWGIALGALSILVLPAPAIARLAGVMGLSGLAENAGIFLAAIAALLVGGVALLAAIAVKRARGAAHQTGAVAPLAARLVQPIDPAAELGSESLDAPLEQTPFIANTPVEPQDAAEALDHGEGQTCESMVEEVKQSQLAPRALDLAQFADLPGRNAVWVEDQVDEQAADFEAQGMDRANPQTTQSAIEKLRQVPPRDLNLVQMVERFAAALHEHQANALKRSGSRQLPQSNAALAQALKALAALTHGSFNTNGGKDSEPGDDGLATLRDTTSELRDALAKLQNLSGAA